MKSRIINLLIAVLFLSSCVDQNSFNPDKETDGDKIKQAEALITTATYEVPVVEGYITTVAYNGLTLARTSTPMSIKVPKEAHSRSRENLTVTYSEGQVATPISNLWQTVLFEDSKKGDFDYNDLVFHTNYNVTGKTLTVAIHPIALGSVKTLKLRFKWTQGGRTETVNVAENCRKDLFNDEQGFVNTLRYDVHYPKMVKTITVDLPNATEAVDIAWFINVNDKELVYAVNQNNDKCLDTEGNPYGFALTNVGSNGEVSRSKSRSMADVPQWATYKPNVSSWAFMPTQPTVPANAIDMSQYKTWGIADNTNFVLKAGSTYSGPICFVKGCVYYIQGTLNLSSFWGEYNVKFVVLPGGELILNTESPLQYAEIDNYGKFTAMSNVLVGKNSILKSNQNIDVASKNITGEWNSKIYIAGDLTAKNLTMNGDSKFFANSVKASTAVSATNTSSIYVNGSIDTPIFEHNAASHCYVDCALRATNSITTTTTAILNVKGYINTPKLMMTASAKINIMSGGMLEAGYIESTNCQSNNINIVGNNMGAVICDKFNFQNTGDVRALLTGKIGFVCNQIQLGGANVLPTDSRIQFGANVVLDKDQVSIPKSECAPGYNESTTEDKGFSWFAYPMESIHINTCYNFEEWVKGNYDFTKKPTAKVFDIHDNNPVKGGKYKIYELEK